MPERSEPIERLRRAILNEGQRPNIHRKELRRLQRKWPVLWRAIMDVTDITTEHDSTWWH